MKQNQEINKELKNNNNNNNKQKTYSPTPSPAVGGEGVCSEGTDSGDGREGAGEVSYSGNIDILLVFFGP